MNSHIVFPLDSSPTLVLESIFLIFSVGNDVKSQTRWEVVSVVR